MYCSKCGTRLNEGDLFCPKCGNRVSEEEKPVEEMAAEKTDLPETEAGSAGGQHRDEPENEQKNMPDQKTVNETSTVQPGKEEAESGNVFSQEMLNEKAPESLQETSDAGETVSELRKNAAEMASVAGQFAAEMASKAGQSVKKAASDISQDRKDAKAKIESSEEKADQAAQGQKSQGFSKFWNSPLFNKAAEKFGNILTVIEGIVFLILMRLLFSEGGFWGIVFGFIFLLAGAGCVIGGIKDLLSRTKKELTEKELNKAKRNMCIGVPIIIIALWILLSTGGGVYSNVQAITFESYGSETIGEIVDNNLKSPKWSKDKIDSTSCKVYVEGYSKLYGEDVRITFYYEEDGGSYEVTLQSVELLDSGETYSDMFSLALIWATFY
ncbi:MAG: zinc-ribbon domain-containing protein [Lachnospiraceae bacterium]|nr:zinc-ribbon domain-containing protein [Lachnospiraceae bacterium]